MRTQLKEQNPYTRETFQALWEISKVVLETIDFEKSTQQVVNIILGQLGKLRYGYDAIVLTLLDKEKAHLKRIAISRTEKAATFLKKSPIPFEEIIIPLDAEENFAVKAIKSKKVQTTDKITDILYPGLPKEWIDSFQVFIGTKTGIVFPILAREKILGALIFTLNKKESEITNEEWQILETFVGSVGIALDNALLFRSLKLTTEKLDKANKRLQELDKLKDDFVSMASHELRTPMTAIKSYLWMALNKKKQDLTPDLNRYIFRAFHSTERLINLVNDMLNISRIESGRIALNLAEVNPVELVHEVVDEVIPKATELSLNVKVIDKQVSRVLCDRDKIHEVIINLIGNSLKFTKSGGSISITFEEKAPFIYISVTDTGVGLAKVDMDRLFKKFSMIEHSYTAASASGGTGLGLYISKSIVVLHKGDITAYSPGREKGSTFTLSLPIAGTSTALELIKEAPKVTQDSKGLEKKRLGYI